MRPSVFFIQLLLFSALTAVLVFGISQIRQFVDYQHFSWASQVFFILLSIFIYGIAWLGSKKNDPMLNFRLGVLFNFLKIIGAIIFVLLYNTYFTPPTQLFVLPFFLIYMLYTIFELYFLVQLFREEK